MNGLRTSSAAAALLVALPAPLLAQDAETPAPEANDEAAAESGDAPPPQAVETSQGKEVYTPTDFARFAPRNALDMLNQVPGFEVMSSDQGRGIGQAGDNVLINGERVASKSDGLFDVLARIAANRVERIEIIDGATLGIPGLSGQVANVFTKPGAISGRYEYRAVFRPKYAEPSFIAGEVSVSGTTPRLEWTLAATHNAGRGAAGGPGIIRDSLGVLTENRDVRIKFIGEFPRIAGTLKWNGPGSLVANFNANYSRSYTDFDNDEDRDLVTGVDLFRDFDNRSRAYGYELGGDVDFALGPGRMKLIGLERFNHNNQRSDSISIYSDDAPSTGSRFTSVFDSGERIGRAEYRWDMVGGSWQLDAEAAFNSLDQVSRLFNLEPTGDFSEIPFPEGTARVTEDRYEVVLNHNRTLAKGLTVQLGVGGEYSKLAQAGAGGLTRTFWRPKGSLSLAWTPEQGLDLSLKIARTVGQLAFGDFLANVNLAQNTGNRGNALLVPQQAWEADFTIRKNLGAWGSGTVNVYGRWIEDYIDIIPVNGGESSGNIPSARLYGVALNGTINLDPIGWKGAKINAGATFEDSNVEDPLTFIPRPFSGINDWRGEISIRYDVPDSNWAMGAGFNWSHVQPYIRLFETGRDYEGPIYSFAFIEHKDVFGLTVNLNVFNVTDGRAIFHRTVYTGLRDRTPISYFEHRDLSVQPIIRLQVKGDF